MDFVMCVRGGKHVCSTFFLQTRQFKVLKYLFIYVFKDPPSAERLLAPASLPVVQMPVHHHYSKSCDCHKIN